MIAPALVSEAYQHWNAKHGAPFGNGIWISQQHRTVLETDADPVDLVQRYGPFVLQRNNSTRYFEFPWVFAQLEAIGARSIVEVGGGLSGLQFVLGAQGGRGVVNVDPGGAGFELDPEVHARVQRALRSDVSLINLGLEKAGLPGQSFDAVVSISTIEHLDDSACWEILSEAFRLLRPGGRLILTVDLFLNLYPFTSRTRNKFGRNLPIYERCIEQGFRLVDGVERELFGSSSFDSQLLMRHLSSHMIGATYPALAQCLVLERPM